MKLKKSIKILSLTFGVLTLLIICTILFWLGPTVKLIAQTIGPKALGTPVAIEKLSINPRKGIIHLSGFTIANQENFARSNSVSLASLDIAVDMASLFSPTVLVNQVQINSPYFTFEQSSASDNIAEYIKSIEEFIGYDPNAPEEEKEGKQKNKDSDKPPKVVIVQSLEMNDVQFRLANTDDPAMDIAVGFNRLSISMTNGVVQLDNLYANNPRRLTSKDLFSLERARIQIAPETIYNAPLNVLDVEVTNPHFYVEWAHDADTISEFLLIADATHQRITEWPLPEKSTTAPTTEAEGKMPPPPPEIYDVSVSNFQFNLVNSIDSKRSIKAQLDLFEANMSEGSIGFSNFFITNPGRLETPNLFSLESIDIDLAPESIYTKTPVIRDVQVKKPYLFLETNPETDTVRELLKIAKTAAGSIPTNTPAFATASTKNPPETAIPEISDEPAAPPVELHNLLVNDIQIQLLDTTGSNAPTNPRMLAGIASISIKPPEGKLQIREITVPNMKGFQATNLFHLGEIDIAIDPETLFADQLAIDRIFINSPEVNLEQTEESGNVAELQKSLMSMVPEFPEAETAPEENAPENEFAGPPDPPLTLAEQPVILHQLEITNLTVNLLRPAPTNTTDGAMSYLRPANLMDAGKNMTASTNQTDGVKVEPPLIGFEHLMLKPLEGFLQIDQMYVANPPGFTKKNLVQMDYFLLDLDPDTLEADTLLIEEIMIAKPRVRYERQIMSDNLKALQAEIEQAAVHRQKVMEEGAGEETADTVAAAETSTNTVTETESATPESEEQKVVINKLLIKEGMVHAKLSALPAIPVPFKLDRENIGKEDDNGASLSEIPGMLFNMIYDVIIDAVGNTTGVAGDALKGAGILTFDAVGNVFDGMGNLLSGTAEDVENVVTETKEAVEKTTEKIKKKRRSRRPSGRPGS